ncbi:hypothetical protein V6Z11_D13G121400 [Gossypium hirsutum]
MPWFRIHGKPYLLTPEERQRQLRLGRERRGPLNPRREDFEGSPSTRPRQSPDASSAGMQLPAPTRAPTQSPDAVIQQMIPTQPPFPMMPGMFPSPYMYPNPYMYPFPNTMAGWSRMPSSAPFPVMQSGPSISRPAAQEGSAMPSGSSPFYQSLATYGFQTPSSFMMQTPPHTLFFKGGSSSQVRHPDAELEEPQPPPEEGPQSAPEEEQPPPEARGRRNPARNCRRPTCGTESPVIDIDCRI